MIDLNETFHIIKNIREKKDFNNRLYQKSNEYLKFIFDNIDVKDKKVFTVLASSDQLMAFLYNKASKVDAFDINSLTEYYYYLRKWCMLEKITYPFDIRDTIIKGIIDDVSCSSQEEELAKNFWNRFYEDDFLEKKQDIFYKSYDDDYSLDQMFIDMSLITEQLKKDKTLNFKHIDILKENSFSEKYDLVYLSNILQKAELDEDKLVSCLSNLKKLLNDDGIVLCTNFFIKRNYFDEMINFQKNIFEKDFIYEENVGYNPIVDATMPIYYTYKKK